jgi:hypothetical protein
VTGNSTCVQFWYDPSTNNEPFVAIEGGTWQTCNPLTGGYPSATAATDVRLKNPCCVASDWNWDDDELDTAVGPFVASTDSDIILDEVPPVVQQALLVPSPRASAPALKSYTVKVKAKDTNSGVAKVQAAVNKKKPSKVVAYKTKVRVKLAGKPKFLRARDKAGNFSAWKKLR